MYQTDSLGRKFKIDTLGRRNYGFKVPPPRLGAPKLYDDHIFTVRLLPEDADYIREKIRKTGEPLSEILRTYIEWGIEQEKEG